jgi:multidrug efflux pump subunit AcrB
MESIKKSFIRWATGAVVLLAVYAAASLRVAPPQVPTAASKGRLFTPRKTLMYVSLYANDRKINQDDLVDCADHLWFRLRRSEDVPRNLAKPVFVMRIRLDPDRMQAHEISNEEVMQAMKPSGFFRRDNWLEEAASTVFKVQEYELIRVAKFNSAEERFGGIVLRATSAGEILQLKDVGQAEVVSTLFDISSEVDGHPAATFALDQPPDSDAADVVEDVNERLKVLIKQSCKLGISSQVIEIENRKTLYAVIETPEGSTSEFTSGKCRELSAIAKGIEGITSVTSLAGFQIRTESGAANVGTCLIQWQGRRLTSRLLIEKLQQKCRTIDARIEFFEPPAVLVFVAEGGFSVSVLERTNNELPARGSDRWDDLLNREELADLFNLLVKNYWYYGLVIDNDVALQKRVSIANALKSLARIAACDVEAKPKFRRLVEEVSHSSVKNDRGEMVPYRSFIQLKNRLGLNEIDR